MQALAIGTRVRVKKLSGKYLDLLPPSEHPPKSTLEVIDIFGSGLKLRKPGREKYWWVCAHDVVVLKRQHKNRRKQ